MPITFGEENNEILQCVKWETQLLDNGTGTFTNNEKFQLTRFTTSVFHFNTSCMYKKTASVYFSKQEQKRYEIKLCLQQIDCSKSYSTSIGDSKTIPDCYRTPCVVWVIINESEKYKLEKLPGSDECKSKKIQINLKAENNRYLFRSVIWIKFQTFGVSEIKALKLLSDYLFVQQKNCDVQFCFGDDQQIGGHMNILSAKSSVFAAMFSHEMKEATTGQVFVKDIRSEIFKELLHFIYMGRTCDPLKRNTVLSLFDAADKYDIMDLKQECVRYLLTDIRMDNAIDLMIWADNHLIKEVKEAAVKFVVSNGKEICKTEKWEHLTKNYPDLCLLAIRRMMEVVQFPSTL